MRRDQPSQLPDSPRQSADALPDPAREAPLAARACRPQGTVVHIGKGPAAVPVGGRGFVVIAGPCAVEDEAQLREAGEAAFRAGCAALRGGAFKPRKSPRSFQGLGEPGLLLLAQERRRRGLPVVSEILDARDLPLFAEVDVLQVGARNMHDTALLKALAKSGKPVLLKRGLCATVEEWLLAAEYLLEGGNPDVILCERGVRSSDPSMRNLLDLGAVALAKRATHLPVLVDPSHASGRRELVAPLSLAAAAAGADGLLLEVHPHPAEALCDGPQALHPDELAELVRRLPAVLAAVDRELWVRPAARRAGAVAS